MSDEQKPVAPAEDILYLELTERQIRLLQLTRAEEMAKRIQIRFEDPATDTQAIRQSIHIDGGLDMLLHLLNHDAKLTEQLEEEKQKLLEKHGDQESLFSQTDSF